MIPAADLLEFEQHAPIDRAAKKKAIRQTFAISSARYYLELFKAIDRPEAMRIAPDLTLALLQQRESSRLRQGLREPVGVAAGVVTRAQQASPFDTGRDASTRGRAAQAQDGKGGRATTARSVSKGEARKQRGMTVVDAVADEAWKTRADSAIATLAAKGEPFTSEDVRELAGDPPGHPNAMGPRFYRASVRKLIVQVGTRKARRASLHSHPLGLWIGTGSAEVAS